MNREILFRGKSVDNGEWVYGYYLVAAGMPFISTFGEKEPIAVIPETAGQFTGLYDKNGNKIFEGDIVKVTSTNWWQGHEVEKVVYKKVVVSFHEKTQEIQFKEIGARWNIKMSELYKSNEERHYLEVIGNVHEEAKQ